MAGTSDHNHHEVKANISSYFDAFNFDAFSVSVEPEAFSEMPPPMPDPVSKADVATQGIPTLKNFSGATQEVQRLRKLLEHSRPVEPEPQPPAPVRSRQPKFSQRFNPVKLSVALSGLVLIAGSAYRYHELCDRRGLCQSTDVEVPQISSMSQSVLHVSPAAPPAFREAVNAAMRAAELTQVAYTVEEWGAVANDWLQAVHLMRAVPKSSLYYDKAQQKVEEYLKNLTYAQRKLQISASRELTDAVSISNQFAPMYSPIPDTGEL